ncbi:MAG: hypothetical protein ABR915_00860 [Thermoguttaceae bacterium]
MKHTLTPLAALLLAPLAAHAATSSPSFSKYSKIAIRSSSMYDIRRWIASGLS